MNRGPLAVTTALLSVVSVGMMLARIAARAALGAESASNASVMERTPLIGQWETEDSKFTIVYLPDSRVASLDRRPASAAAIRMETGVYQVEADRIKYQWMLTEPQEEQFRVEGDTLVAGSPNSPVRSRSRRVGGADKASQTYEEIYQSVHRVAEISFKEVSVGSIQPGLLRATGIIPDTHSVDVFPKATVYSQETRFQWVLSPPHQYARHSPDEPGVTACSYTFLPNGRFYFDGWWYGLLLDDSLPFDERNPAEVRGREVPMRHTQFWGKYRVTPGHDALDGDTVEMIYNDGSHHTVRVMDGRRYLITPKSHLLFNNWDQVQKHRQ